MIPGAQRSALTADVAAQIRRDVEFLAAHPRHRTDPDHVAAARDYVQHHFQRAGWQVRRQPIDLRWRAGITDNGGKQPWPLRIHRRLTGENLIATQPGQPGPYLVIAAHLDSVRHSPGADDNAAAVAVLLAVARQAGRTGVPVLLAGLDMEEVGHFGATALATELAAAGQVTSMICLDMVGFYDDTAGSQQLRRPMRRLMTPEHGQRVFTERRGDFLLVVHRRSSAGHAAALIEACTDRGLSAVGLRDPRRDGRVGQLLTFAVPPLAALDRSDHVPFQKRRIPAMFLTDTATMRSPHYHQPTDTPDTLDYGRLAALATALTAVPTTAAATTAATR